MTIFAWKKKGNKTFVVTSHSFPMYCVYIMFCYIYITCTPQYHAFHLPSGLLRVFANHFDTTMGFYVALFFVLPPRRNRGCSWRLGWSQFSLMSGIHLGTISNVMHTILCIIFLTWVLSIHRILYSHEWIGARYQSKAFFISVSHSHTHTRTHGHFVNIVHHVCVWVSLSLSLFLSLSLAVRYRASFYEWLSLTTLAACLGKVI